MTATCANRRPRETTAPDSNAVAMGERRCSECDEVFRPNGSRSARCWSCIYMKRKRFTSGFSGRRARLTDTVKDIAYAIAELTQAHRELSAIAANGNSSQHDAALIEPASRVGLACAFLDEVEHRMGWSRAIRDDSRDPFRTPAERKRRNPDSASIQGEPDGPSEGAGLQREP